jgi:hypothetical protein
MVGVEYICQAETEKREANGFCGINQYGREKFGVDRCLTLKSERRSWPGLAGLDPGIIWTRI